MTMDKKDQSKRLGQVIAKAWSDDAFKERLLSDPRKVLGEHGITLPEGIEVKAVENTDKVFHLVIPQAPHPSGDTLQLLEERVAASGYENGGCFPIDAGLLGG